MRWTVLMIGLALAGCGESYEQTKWISERVLVRICADGSFLWRYGDEYRWTWHRSEHDKWHRATENSCREKIS